MTGTQTVAQTHSHLPFNARGPSAKNQGLRRFFCLRSWNNRLCYGKPILVNFDAVKESQVQKFFSS